MLSALGLELLFWGPGNELPPPLLPLVVLTLKVGSASCVASSRKEDGRSWGGGGMGQPLPLGHVIVGFKSFPQATRYGTNQYQPQE